MSEYTMTLEELGEMWTMNEHYDVPSKVEALRKKLFDFHYPFFDESKKKDFETHFIRNFYFREIGFETEGRFKFELESWLNLHMPYFNQLFQSELLEYDPLLNMKIETEHNKKNQRDQKDNRTIDNTSTTTGKSHSENDTSQSETTSGKQDGTSEATNDGFKRDIKADTPDSRLNLTTNDGSGVIEYASEIGEGTDKGKQTGKHNETQSGKRDGTTESKADMTAESQGRSNSNDQYTSDVDQNEDYTSTQNGKIGSVSFAQMVNEYRSTFLRVEKQIFKEISQLFMLIY